MYEVAFNISILIPMNAAFYANQKMMRYQPNNNMHKRLHKYCPSVHGRRTQNEYARNTINVQIECREMFV